MHMTIYDETIKILTHLLEALDLHNIIICSITVSLYVDKQHFRGYQVLR